MPSSGTVSRATREPRPRFGSPHEFETGGGSIGYGAPGSLDTPPAWRLASKQGVKPIRFRWLLVEAPPAHVMYNL